MLYDVFRVTVSFHVNFNFRCQQFEVIAPRTSQRQTLRAGYLVRDHVRILLKVWSNCVQAAALTIELSCRVTHNKCKCFQIVECDRRDQIESNVMSLFVDCARIITLWHDVRQIDLAYLPLCEPTKS